MLYAAVLDACVLVPSHLRHLLLRVAAEGVYRPLWTERTWAEARSAVKDAKGAAVLATFDAHAARIRTTFDDAMVTGWGPLEAGMGNHPKDRHVLAAAVTGRADAIVSDDAKGFAAAALAPYAVGLQTPTRS